MAEVVRNEVVNGQAQRLREFGEAADDLGYFIVSLEPAEVVLEPKRPGWHDRITVESKLLDGAYLRRVLKPLGDLDA